MTKLLEQKIIAGIEDYETSRKRKPSLQELAAYCEKSKTTIWKEVKKMIGKGILSAAVVGGRIISKSLTIVERKKSDAEQNDDCENVLGDC